jgi:hypothetical protein
MSVALFAGLHGRLCGREDADCSVVEGRCGGDEELAIGCDRGYRWIVVEVMGFGTAS